MQPSYPLRIAHLSHTQPSNPCALHTPATCSRHTRCGASCNPARCQRNSPQLPVRRCCFCRRRLALGSRHRLLQACKWGRQRERPSTTFLHTQSFSNTMSGAGTHPQIGSRAIGSSHNPHLTVPTGADRRHATEAREDRRAGSNSGLRGALVPQAVQVLLQLLPTAGAMQGPDKPPSLPRPRISRYQLESFQILMSNTHASHCDSRPSGGHRRHTSGWVEHLVATEPRKEIRTKTAYK
jgi:hypothetical protein